MSHYVNGYIGRGTSINLAGFGATRDEPAVASGGADFIRLTQQAAAGDKSAQILLSRLSRNVRPTAVQKAMPVSTTPVAAEIIAKVQASLASGKYTLADVIVELQDKASRGGSEGAAYTEALAFFTQVAPSSSAPASLPSSKAPFVIAGILGLGGLVLFMIKKKK